MPDKKQIDLGPIGAAVAANIERLRKSQNLSYAELSRRLDALECPIAPLGLTRIREHQRRVDVDDLVALALALGVSPATLLLPGPDASTAPGSAGGKVPVTEGGEHYPLSQVWRWFVAESPIDVAISFPPSAPVVEFQLRARPDAVTSVPINPERLESMMSEMLLGMKDARFTQVEDARRDGDHIDGDD
jgi:transcriptional regulator with XRE-family HTH domain